MKVEWLVLNFREFVLASWPSIEGILEQLNWDEDPYYIDEWMEANWSLMFERFALEKGQNIIPYGYYNPADLRRAVNEGSFTHRLVCTDRGTLESKYYFNCFVSRSGSGIAWQPPFDLISAVGESDQSRVNLNYRSVDFSVEPLV